MPVLNQTVVANRGLCSICTHGEECIYPRNRDQIVLNCEQFDPCPPTAPPQPDPDRMKLEELWRKSLRDLPGRELRGLCSNCEERHTCIYPKPVGGVWRCEEYR